MSDSGNQPDTRQKEITEDEKKRINIDLRGGENVKDKEEELDLLGQGAQKIGEKDGQTGRDTRVDRELNSDEAKKGGRKGGERHYD